MKCFEINNKYHLFNDLPARLRSNTQTGLRRRLCR